MSIYHDSAFTPAYIKGEYQVSVSSSSSYLRPHSSRAYHRVGALALIGASDISRRSISYDCEFLQEEVAGLLSLSIQSIKTSRISIMHGCTRNQLYPNSHLITYSSALTSHQRAKGRLTPSKQSPPLCLFTTLDTFLVVALWEIPKSSLIMWDT